MDDHDEIKKRNTDLIQHEIPQNCTKKTRKYKRKVKYKYESRYTKLSQFMTFHCQICSSKKYTVFSSYKEHMANWHGVAPKTLNEQFLESIKKKRKYKPRIKKSNTVITEVEKQMPLELKNDDNKVSENSTDHIKPEKSYQIPINSNSCVSHKSMTLDDNMALDTSDEAGTNADTSNNKNESLNVLNDNFTISIPADDNINSMDMVDNDTSTLVSANNNATSGINNYIINKNTIKSKKESRYNKLSQSMTFYCQVCSKKYITFNTFKVHMANFHGVASKTLNKYYFGTQERKQYEPCSKSSNTVITEVENHMPLELKNDDSKVSENSAKNKFYSGTKQRRKYKPRIKKSNTVITEVENPSLLELKNDDNKISENSTDHIKPEKSYQIPINSNSCVSHKSMTLDDNITLDTSDEAGTNADTSNNKNESLNVLNDNCTISIPANDNINSMDVVDNDTSTLQDFASVSDFEKHQQCNIYENLIICQNQKNVMACEPKEHYINANYNELFNSEIIPPSIPSKDTWTPDENHMKALNEICVVQQPFYCGFCKEMCEQYDHYQLNQWCSFNENLKCHVCYQEFSDRKQLELHEREHVKLHFC